MDARIDDLIARMPEGCGFNREGHDILKNGKVRVYGSYHVMSEWGYYVGYADFSVTFDPTLPDDEIGRTFRLMFHGQTSHYLARYYDLREYIEDTVYYGLTES